MKKVILTLALTLFCFTFASQVPAPSAKGAVSSNQGQDKKDPQPGSTNKDQTKSPVTSLLEPVPSISDPKREPQKRHNSDHHASDEHSQEPDILLGLSTNKWLAIFTGCLVVLSFLQQYAMRGQRQSMENQEGWMKENVGIAKISATAAQKSADLAEKAILGLERPLLVPKIKATFTYDQLATFARAPRRDTAPILHFTLVNRGRTPATIEDHQEIFLHQTAEPIGHYFELPDSIIEPGRTIVALAGSEIVDRGQESTEFSIALDDYFPQPNYLAGPPRAERVLNFCYFYGLVHYADIFGDTHISKFCYRLIAYPDFPVCFQIYGGRTFNSYAYQQSSGARQDQTK